MNVFNTMTLKKCYEDIYLTQGEKNLLFILAKKYNNDISREILAEGNNKESDFCISIDWSDERRYVPYRHNRIAIHITQ